MMPSKPMNFDHMKGDAACVQDLEVRCIVEFEDDETFRHRNHNKMIALPECPVMRQRLARHMRECRGRRPLSVDSGTRPLVEDIGTEPVNVEIGTCCSECQAMNFDNLNVKEKTKSVTNQEVLTDFFGKSIALSPSISMDDKLTGALRQIGISKSLAREAHMRTRHNRKNNTPETRVKENYTVENNTSNEYKLKNSETVILHPKGQYKDHLQTIILQWLMEIPVFPCIDQAAKISKEKAIEELNEAICRLSGDVNDDSYEDYVKFHIKNFIDNLPIWFMCTIKEQDVYKSHLINNLFQKIKILNMESFNENFDKNTYVRKCSHRKTDRSAKIEELVVNFINSIKLIEKDDWGNTINMKEVKKVILNRLKPVVKAMSQMQDSKSYLKNELINILKDIPIAWPYNTNENLDKYAEDLADNIQAVCKHVCFRNNMNKTCIQNLEAIYDDQRDMDFIKFKTIKNTIQYMSSVVDVDFLWNNEDELVDILGDSYDSIQSGNESDARSAIYEFLNTSFVITKENAASLANLAVEKMKNASKLTTDRSCSPIFLKDNVLSKDVMVYLSDHDLSGEAPTNYPITSTPKKDIPKFNAEERKYTDNLYKFISTWIDTIPEFAHVNNDKNYKDVMVSDLAGHLTDEIKLEQYTPDKKYYGSRENMISCAIRSWMIKFEETAFKIIEDIKPYIDDFIKQFQEIPIPTLTRPQHGNRNEINNLVFRENFSDENIDFVPDGLDIIKDGISIWMNEQPDHIYLNENRDVRNDLLDDFAVKIQHQLKNKRPSDEIKHETRIWLKKILKLNEMKNLDILAEGLKNKIIKMQLSDSFEDNLKDMGNNIQKENILPKHADKPTVNTTADGELNKTLKHFIDKFIEHNCEEDDSLVKGAYCELLKSEFRRYSPESKEELYSKGGEPESKDKLPHKLKRELYYIKVISDWLKNIPIENSFNVSGNNDRIGFIMSLAKDICEVEMERMQAPDLKDYDKQLSELVYNNYVKKIPILSNSIQYEEQIVQELINKIVKSRNELNNMKINKTANDSLYIEMQEQNIGEFIDEYIRVNGKEIADDPVKLEVWNARLLKEINRMVNESETPSSLKMKVYDKVADISIPGKDSVIEFDRKLNYAHEIGDWIKNMPLKPVLDHTTSVMIARMINDLAEKLTEKQSIDINNDPELTQYVTDWILALPLEYGKAIDTSVLIQQLSKRINRVNESKNQSLNITDGNGNKSTTKTNQSNSKQSMSKSQKRNSSTGKSKVGSSGELVVEAIQDWCNKLPIKEKKDDDEKVIKDNIAVRLFQKVGDLNLDARFNDDILYKDQLNNEIDEIFKDLQKYNDVIKKKEALKASLTDNIVNARGIVKERTAGDIYRHKLENTIEASIPSPITYSKIYDPGFELYKNKLANIFILENFDHGDDPVKFKYEVKIKDEIDKYFTEAQKRNAVPLSRDNIYNELYSALYKVPVPNEKSVIQEVEEVKLRCEIDGWFESLPIREAINLNEQLDWDQILSVLVKRTYEIESNNPKADDLIQKEVTKWLIKFPMLPGEENNMDKHAKSLVDRLKASKDERKCTPKSKKDKGKGKSSKKAAAKRDSLNKTQAPSDTSVMWRTNSMRRASQLSGASLNPCCIAASTPKRKTADIILEIVENWCQNLPLSPESGENESTIKDDLVTKILRKLSELNANPEIFDDDFLYDDYLDDELDRLMKTFPLCCKLQQNTEFKKFELISALRKIKPLLKAEKARHKYKKEIRSTVRNMLRGPLDTTPEKALFDDLVDDIADSFVQYNYNENDHEEKHLYRNRIRDALIKFYSEFDEKDNEDTLIRQNKFICELGKIPNPGEEALKEEIDEIRMKEEVSIFLEEVIPNESTEKKKLIKTNLSKRLHDLERSGHTCATDKSMREVIDTSLKKTGTEVDMDKIEDFVNTLKNNESIRKSPPGTRSHQTSVNVSQQLIQHGWKSGQFADSSAEPNYEYQPPTPQHYPTFPSSPGGHISYEPSSSIKYHTLPPENLGYRPPGAKSPGTQGPQATQWFQPDASHLKPTGSQDWHTLPTLSPGQRQSEVALRSPSAWQTLPSPSPGYKTTRETIQSYLRRPSSVQTTNIRPVSPDRSVDQPNVPPPGRNLDERYPRRHSFEVQSNQNDNKEKRRTSLQIPLSYDSDLMLDKIRLGIADRNVPKSYKEVCNESQRNSTPNAPINAHDSVVSSAQSPKAATRIPRPVSSPLRSSISSKSPPRTSPQSQTSVVEPTLSSRPVQSNQGIQDAEPGLAPIPISAVPQSTRNAASIRDDVGPTVSNIPQETPEAPEGTHRMATAPHLTNPPRKRRRIAPDEEERDICDCLLQTGRKRRCLPLLDEWGGYPVWCYMPVPGFCYF